MLKCREGGPLPSTKKPCRCLISGFPSGRLGQHSAINFSMGLLLDPVRIDKISLFIPKS